MIIVKYIDIYQQVYDDESGQVYNDLVHSNFTVPDIIDPSDIISIGPYFGTNKKLFKNVSYVKDRYGNTFKVVGNYKKLNEIRKKPRRGTIGYGKTTD